MIRVSPKDDSVIWPVSKFRCNPGGQVYLEAVTPKSQVSVSGETTSYSGTTLTQVFERPMMAKGTRGPESSHECVTHKDIDLSIFPSALPNGPSFLSCEAFDLKNLAVESEQVVYQRNGSLFFEDQQSTSGGWIGLAPARG